MRLSIVLLVALYLVVGPVSAIAEDSQSGPGPAPGSGDGISEGPEWPGDKQPGPISSGSGDSGQGHQKPAPNSGDGVPDGPGW